MGIEKNNYVFIVNITPLFRLIPITLTNVFRSLAERGIKNSR